MGSIADHFLPMFHYSEQHQIAGVRSSPAIIFESIQEFDDTQDRVLNILIKAREFPSRFIAGLRDDEATLKRARFGLQDFVLLQETTHEIAFGLAGKFWLPNYGLTKVSDASDFMKFAEPASAKLVITFSLAKQQDESYTITTETRIWCQDLRARMSFLPYWILIRPASGWIRQRILNQIKIVANHSFSITER